MEKASHCEAFSAASLRPAVLCYFFFTFLLFVKRFSFGLAAPARYPHRRQDRKPPEKQQHRPDLRRAQPWDDGFPSVVRAEKFDHEAEGAVSGQIDRAAVDAGAEEQCGKREKKEKQKDAFDQLRRNDFRPHGGQIYPDPGIGLSAVTAPRHQAPDPADGVPERDRARRHPRNFVETAKDLFPAHFFGNGEIQRQKNRPSADQAAVKRHARLRVYDEFSALGKIIDRLEQHGEPISDRNGNEDQGKTDILQFGRDLLFIRIYAENDERRHDPDDG